MFGKNGCLSYFGLCSREGSMVGSPLRGLHTRSRCRELQGSVSRSTSAPSAASAGASVPSRSTTRGVGRTCLRGRRKLHWAAMFTTRTEQV